MAVPLEFSLEINNFLKTTKEVFLRINYYKEKLVIMQLHSYRNVKMTRNKVLVTLGVLNDIYK